MDTAFEYILTKINERLRMDIDLIPLADDIIVNDPEFNRLNTLNKLGFYLSSDDLENDYDELIKASEDGLGDSYARDFVSVWEPIEHFTVDEILDLI